MQAAEKIRPAVILVTVFDSTGKMLRSGTGFFVSENGRIVTTLHTMDGSVNAVAKTADDQIYNITGVIASSTKMDLAVLSAEVKSVPFMLVNKEAKPQASTSAAAVGCALAGREGAPVEATILANEDENQFQLSARVAPISFGAPIIDANGDLIGVVTGRDKENENAVIARPVSVISSLLGEARSTAGARWPGQPQPTPTPKLRLVFAPAPRYPLEARFRDGLARTGRFRVNFDVTGTVKEIQVLKSTGSDILDSAAVQGLQQWRSEPGREGFTIVPLTFQAR
jgi:TonB family protein